MAMGRRGRPPDIKGTLGTLLRTTLNQVGALRDAVERQARSQRGWFDSALLERQRKDVLASLGEVIYELAVSGELGDLEEFPEVARLVRDLEEIDVSIEDRERDLGGRSRIRERSGRSRDREREREVSREPDEPVRVWRPVAGSDEVTPRGSRRQPRDHDDAELPAEEPAADPGPPRARTRRPARSSAEPSRKRPARKRGGIAFVDDGGPGGDADLESYMNADDVPARDGEPGEE